MTKFHYRIYRSGSIRDEGVHAAETADQARHELAEEYGCPFLNVEVVAA